MEDTKLQKLESLIQVLDKDTVTQEEVVDAFQQLVDFVISIKESNDEERSQMNEEINLALNKACDKCMEMMKTFYGAEWMKIKAKVDSLKDGEMGPMGPQGPAGQSIVGPMGPQGPAGLDAEIDPEEFAILAAEYLKTLEGEEGIPMSAIKDLEDTIATLQNRTQMLVQIATQRQNTSTSTGGGHVIEDEGTPLTQRANLNFTGAGVTVTDSGGKTVVTIPGGGGGGITRSVVSVSVDTSAGADALTDYVYLVSGTTILTLPTAVGNTNMYTVKNVGVATVTVATTAAQTIDGSASVSMPVANQSLDFISDNSNWNIV